MIDWPYVWKWTGIITSSVSVMSGIYALIRKLIKHQRSKKAQLEYLMKSFETLYKNETTLINAMQKLDGHLGKILKGLSDIKQSASETNAALQKELTKCKSEVAAGKKVISNLTIKCINYEKQQKALERKLAEKDGEKLKNMQNS